MEEQKTLYELFNEQLSLFPNNKSYPYKSIEEFIFDDEKSVKFINRLNYGENTMYNDVIKNDISQGRARHSIISLFLGLILGKFKKLFENCSSILKKNDNDLSSYEKYLNFKLWMITAINHDYGYHSRYVLENVPIERLPIKYDLFDDKINFNYIPLMDYSSKYSHVLKNNYNQIKEYYIYSQKFHNKNNDIERNDHGILGALLLYDRVNRKYANQFNECVINKNYINENFQSIDMLLYKTACLTIAQHNIYKSKCEENDELYGPKLSHLYYNSKYVIDEKYVLLYLLTLVDTIECVKLFSKSESETKYFETLTILKNIELLVKDDEITIDFSKLYNKIKKDKEELIKKIIKHMDNIKDLSSWTTFNVIKISDTVLKIT